MPLEGQKKSLILFFLNDTATTTKQFARSTLSTASSE